MALSRAKEHLARFGMDGRIITFDTSSATVELAAEAAGTEPARIAKTLSFMTREGPVLIVTAGDRKIDNPKYKAFFGQKAKMLKFEEVEDLIGHGVGGVCPFGAKEGVRIFLDDSLKRFETIFPAAGEENNAIQLTPEELESCVPGSEWVDLSKPV